MSRLKSVLFFYVISLFVVDAFLFYFFSFQCLLLFF